MTKGPTTSVPLRGYVVYETPTKIWIVSTYGTWIVGRSDVVSRELVGSPDGRAAELIYLRHDAEINEP